MEAPWPRAEIHQEFRQGVPRCFFTCCGNSYDSMVGVEGAWTLDVAILEDKLERSRRGNQSVFQRHSRISKTADTALTAVVAATAIRRDPWATARPELIEE